MAMPTTDTLPATFEEAFFSTIEHNYQQQDQLLAPHVTQGGHFVGDKAYFPSMDAVTVDTLTRLQEMNVSVGTHKFVEVDTANRYVVLPVFDIDKNKLTPNVTAAYAQSVDMALKRDLDLTIYTAMLALANAPSSPIQSIGNYNDPLSLSLLMEGAGYLEDEEAFSSQPVCYTMNGRSRMRLAGDLNLAMKRAQQSVGQGSKSVSFLDPLDHMTPVVYNGGTKLTTAPSGNPALNAGVVGTDHFMWAKNAVCGAYNDQLVKISERHAMMLANLVGGRNQTGAVVRFPKGIVRIKCRRNPPAGITPLSTKEAA